MNKYTITSEGRVVATAHSERAAKIKTADMRRRGYEMVFCYQRKHSLLTAF